MSYCIFVDGAEIQVLLDALVSLEDHYDGHTVDSLYDRLSVARRLSSVWADQYVRHLGVGKYRDHPQG
jgi:hypothetical protein